MHARLGEGWRSRSHRSSDTHQHVVGSPQDIMIKWLCCWDSCACSCDGMFRSTTEQGATVAMTLSCISSLHVVCQELTAVLLVVDEYTTFWQVRATVQAV